MLWNALRYLPRFAPSQIMSPLDQEEPMASGSLDCSGGDRPGAGPSQHMSWPLRFCLGPSGNEKRPYFGSVACR